MESRIHILLIEDNPADVRLIREYLSFAPMQSYELFQSSTLKGGNEILKKEPIDIILLDLHLPDSLGLKSFDRLIETFSNLPIIVLTGLSDDATGLRAVKKGAQDFLSKDDLNPESLIRCIRYGIERHQMLTRLEQAQKLAKMGNWEYLPAKEEVYCSKSAQSILELDQDHNSLGLENYFKCLVSDDRIKLIDAISTALLNQEEFRVDAKTRISIHGQRYLAIQGKAGRNHPGESLTVVGTVQDVTDRIEREQLIREKELAIKSAKLKEEFLANTSHEIRTPLNAILQLTRILMEGDTVEEQMKYLNLIKNAGSTLLAVVNDVLDFSKIEAGKMDFSQSHFELNLLIDSVIAIMELKANEEKLRLNKFVDEGVPAYLVGDPVRLNQILLNLINNAIKYTEEGFVNIHVRVKGKKGNQVLIEIMVEDSGIGIPANKLDFIFLGFQRLDTDLNRKYSGTGLGLTIVEQLVKLQGGDISVKSEVGKGSSFIFSLPFEIGEKPNRQKPHKVVNHAGEMEGRRVLLVEDNLLNQMVTEHLLHEWGVQVDIASNGKIAIELLLKSSYDLILMDLQMPVMDGYDTTRYIRNELSGDLSQIPIIALTANAFHGMDDECMKIGMNDYLSKPFEKGVLFAKMNACMKPMEMSRFSLKEKPASPQNHLQPEVPNSSSQRFDVINLAYLKEVSGKDQFIFNLAINKFLESSPDSLDLIDEYLHGEEYQELARAVHKLKSSVATMGMEHAKNTILEIENILRNNLSKARLPMLVSELRGLVEKSFAELHAALKNEVL